jgi:hypothetical protein
MGEPIRELIPIDQRDFLEMPSPTEMDLVCPFFEAIWQATKDWDLNAPKHYAGYCSMNGSHVMIILNAMREVAERARSGKGDSRD